jgi:hypothetical protein
VCSLGFSIITQAHEPQSCRAVGLGSERQKKAFVRWAQHSQGALVAVSSEPVPAPHLRAALGTFERGVFSSDREAVEPTFPLDRAGEALGSAKPSALPVPPSLLVRLRRCLPRPSDRFSTLFLQVSDIKINILRKRGLP